MLDSIPHSPLRATLFGGDTGKQTTDCLQNSQDLNLNCDFLGTVPPECLPTQESQPGVLVLLGALISWWQFVRKHIPFGQSCNFQGSEKRAVLNSFTAKANARNKFSGQKKQKSSGAPVNPVLRPFAVKLGITFNPAVQTRHSSEIAL